MVAMTVGELFNKLGVAKSHSRPHVSNDNPYSEPGFKTMKYRPTFPDRFASIEDTRRFYGPYLLWYNEEHHHTGLALLTPATVHYGRTDLVLAQRQVVLDAAYEAHPERYVNGRPQVARPPSVVWINPPLPVEVAADPVTGSADAAPAVAGREPTRRTHTVRVRSTSTVAR